MTDCAGSGTIVPLLLDGELIGEELDKAREHLETCSECRQLLKEQQDLSQMVRQARSPQVVPSSLRDRILHMTAETSLVERRWSESDRPATAFVPSGQRTSDERIWKRLVLVAAALVVTVSSILFPQLRSRSRENNFIETAIRADHNLSTHITPLDVESNSPQVVKAWFSGKVPFEFRLPNSGVAADDTSKYTMLGGRLVDFRGEHAAVIAFQMSGAHISLLIASDRQAKAAGGRVSQSDGVTFHSRDVQDHHVVTWDKAGLTYALIFGTPPSSPSARSTCGSCHGDAAGQTVDRTYLAPPYDLAQPQEP